jgi:very-short-patch-repair endonuclease
MGLGFSAEAIRHRLANGRLHQLFPGVYSVGRPEVNQYGRWMAAVLACGPRAFLSHVSGGALMRIRSSDERTIHVSVPAPRAPRHRGIVVHRRAGLDPADVTRRHDISVASPALTLINLAASLSANELAAAVNEADKLDLIDPEALRARLDRMPRRPGVGALRRLLDRTTLLLTDSELERRFIPIARRAGLPAPRTQVWLHGFRVDFYWPDLGLVVETDGLRYHRTPAQQAKDRRRGQALTAAGLTPLRFTHAQIAFDLDEVESTLRAVLMQLARPAA